MVHNLVAPQRMARHVNTFLNVTRTVFFVKQGVWGEVPVQEPKELSRPSFGGSDTSAHACNES